MLIYIDEGFRSFHKEVVRLAWSACPHASHGNRIKNERHKHCIRRYSAHFGELSTLYLFTKAD